MSIIIFLIVLAALVFVHELGHFLAAKKAGIRVDEFGLGFPPRLIGKKIGETLYSLNLIPFGGFVKIFGENPDDESLKGPDSSRSFVHKPKYIQALVLAAGILFNFIFAWILVTLSFMIGVAASSEDYPQYTSRIQHESVMITSLSPKSPALEAGLKPGDRIKEITVGSSKVTEDHLSVESVQNIIAASEGKEIALTVYRGQATSVVKTHAVNTIVPGKYAIGISMDKVGILSLPIHRALWEGGKLTLHMIAAVATGIGQFVYDAVVGRADFSSVSGPVGIVGLVGDATRLGFTYLLMFTAVISINLGVINLVPFPALDGGRILFVIIESIRRKAIDPKIANTVNSVGFILLILLMVIVTYKDIVRLIH